MGHSHTFHSTHDGRVSKDRLVLADDYAYASSVSAGTGLLEGKQQLSTIAKMISSLSANSSKHC